MRIVIIGAGAIGISIGASLAGSGADVSFLVRTARLKTLQKQRFYLRYLGEENAFSDIKLKDNPRDLNGADLVIVAVKMYDFKPALKLAATMLSGDGCVATIQNGVEAPTMAAKVVGKCRVIAGVSWLGANYIDQGMVEMFGGMTGRPWFEFGCMESDAVNKKTLDTFVSMLRSAGLPAKIRTDVNFLLWEKFCLIAATSSVSALLRKTIGEIRQDPDGINLIEKAIREAVEVGNAAGASLKPSQVRTAMVLIDSMPFSASPSQLADLLIGKPLELEWLSGFIVRLGLSKGILTPYHDIVFAALKPYAKGGMV